MTQPVSGAAETSAVQSARRVVMKVGSSLVTGSVGFGSGFVGLLLGGRRVAGRQGQDASGEQHVKFVVHRSFSCVGCLMELF